MFTTAPDSGISALLVCTSLHPEHAGTQVQCRAFVDMNVTKQQHSPAAYQLFLIHTGELASCRAATAPQSQSYTVTMCLRIHLGFVDKRQTIMQRVAPV